jgi:peptidyl-prolyl cis-trans isomerase SurA
VQKVLALIALILPAALYCMIHENKEKEYEGIVAVVNNEIITSQDLHSRILLALFSMGNNIDPELKEKFSREVLKDMIIEKLKSQCAKKFEPKGGWAPTDEVKKVYQDIAKRNNLSEESFTKLLESKGIAKNILLKQIKVNLSWIAYINAKFGRFIRISDSEVKRTMKEIKEKQNQESYYIHRMFFPVSDSKNESAVSVQVSNIKQMIVQGANFGDLARQFSKSPDANKGGEIGWVFQGQLSPEEDSALQNAKIGDYVIVRNSRGYVLIFLQDKKNAGVKDFTTIKFVQVVIPYSSENLGKEEVLLLMNAAMDLKKSATNSQDFLQKAKEAQFCAISEPVSTTLETILPQFRTIITSIPAGGISNPIVMPNGITIICVLDRKIQKIQEPTFNDIKTQKANERLSVFADREARDMQNKSDIKINEQYGSAITFTK